MLCKQWSIKSKPNIIKVVIYFFFLGSNLKQKCKTLLIEHLQEHNIKAFHRFSDKRTNNEALPSYIEVEVEETKILDSRLVGLVGLVETITPLINKEKRLLNQLIQKVRNLRMKYFHSHMGMTSRK